MSWVPKTEQAGGSASMQGCGSQSSNSSKHLTSPALYSIEWLAKASIQMARYIILLLYTVISSAINGLFGQMKRGISWLNTKPEHLRLMSNKKKLQFKHRMLLKINALFTQAWISNTIDIMKETQCGMYWYTFKSQQSSFILNMLWNYCI